MSDFAPMILDIYTICLCGEKHRIERWVRYTERDMAQDDDASAEVAR